jgi:predicted alpha-1,2-mannosidase
MKHYFGPTIFALLIFFNLNITLQSQTNFAQYVNPMIGTGGHGHTFPGATVPFGMVQLSPDTRIDGSWDGCSGYHHDDKKMYGFSHTHLSGTGCSDYGDILLFPTTETITSADLKKQKYSSAFNHANEKTNAGYYSVQLDNGVKAELTATTRVGFHQYQFSESEFAYIILDLELRDKVINALASIKSNNKVSGYRRSQAWAKDQYIAYDLEFSEPFVDVLNADGSVLNKTDNIEGKNVRLCFKFKMPANHIIKTKIALSPTSPEAAEKNMVAECAHWDFEKTKKEAEANWNKELSKIEIKTSNQEQKTIFYTALYHTMIQPNTAMDVDGTYRGRDNKIHKAIGFTYYSVFSLWDTFRGAHPLYTIIDQKRTSDFINTFIKQYEEGGRLPVWELASNETECMIGYHAVSVIADAIVKGIKGFDYEKAYKACKNSAMLDHFGLKCYKSNGFISAEDEGESVSKTLEYAYDDWCIAQIAKVLNKTVDYSYFMKRSQSWKNVFDSETGFMRAKKNGNWVAPFEPSEVNTFYTEGNAWQYAFFVPQDINGLITKIGGEEKFGEKLDELFTASSITTGREQADISGLIGQYAHGNEPSHHMAYLYNYINETHRSAFYANQIIHDFYKAEPDGLIGNEDCGQMSAWYVLSSMGFYQVTPGTKQFVFGSPQLDTVKIHLENGKTCNIISNNRNKENIYIASKKINGKDYNENYFNYENITNGDSLVFEMDNMAIDANASKPLAKALINAPEAAMLSIPIIDSDKSTFIDSLLINIKSDAPCLYSICDMGTKPNTFKPFTQAFYIHHDKTVHAFAKNKTITSDTVQATFKKRTNNWTIKLINAYKPEYSAGGEEAVIDGLKGAVNWRKGDWQGYQGKHFEAVIDLGKIQNVNTISASFLQDSKSWILFPTKVSYYVSEDNTNFVLHSIVNNTIVPNDEIVQLQTIKSNNKKVVVRYIKIKAYSFGKLPEWHEGKGGDAWIFVDEVEIK